MKKEKINRQVIFVTQQSLFNSFGKKCKEKYKTVSVVLRELMLEYINKKND